jgi:hypothetical protein
MLQMNNYFVVTILMYYQIRVGAVMVANIPMKLLFDL